MALRLFQCLNQFTLVFSLQLRHTVLKFGVKLKTVDIKKVSILQNKAIRLSDFASIDEHADPLYNMCNILRLSDTVNLQNFLYVYDDHHHNLPKAVSNTFKSIKDVHSHLTLTFSSCSN